MSPRERECRRLDDRPYVDDRYSPRPVAKRNSSRPRSGSIGYRRPCAADDQLLLYGPDEPAYPRHVVVAQERRREREHDRVVVGRPREGRPMRRRESSRPPDERRPVDGRIRLSPGKRSKSAAPTDRYATSMYPIEQTDPYADAYPYQSVHVLTISFEDDDMRVQGELDDVMDLFKTDFGFRTHRPCIIPSRNPTKSLVHRLSEFSHKYGSSRDNLVILFIACHGILRDGELILGSKAENGAEVKWLAIRDIIMAMESPALLMLDCCAAAGVDPGRFATLPADMRRARANKELIAASGFHEQAPEPGEYSLTHSLIDVLYEVAFDAARRGDLATASDVHGRTKLRMLRLYRPGEDLVRTPLYEILNNGGRSVVLSPTPEKRLEMMIGGGVGAGGGRSGGPAPAYHHPHGHYYPPPHHRHHAAPPPVAFRSSQARVARRRWDRRREKMAAFEAQLREQQLLEQKLLEELTTSDESYFSSAADSDCGSGGAGDSDSGYSSDTYGTAFSPLSDGDVRYQAGMLRRQHSRADPAPCFAYASVPRVYDGPGPAGGREHPSMAWQPRFATARVGGARGVMYADYSRLVRAR